MSSDRRYPSRPFVGVGAVIVDAGHVLIVKRGQPPLAGQWSLPGGVVETGETMAAAAQRETFEETGLMVDVGPVVDVLDRIHFDADGRVEYHYVLVDYLCTAIGGTLHPQSDILDARWVSRDELSAFRLTPGAHAVIDKAFALHAQS